jgi:AcrR family transcriptional regulator
MSSEPSPARAIGRPREARADRAILTATLQLMAERGVRDLRMDDVADRAGVGKATIYRRYRSKDALVSDAIATLVSEIEIPDTGSTRADLLALMRQAVELYSGSLAARLMPAVLEETRRNPELASTVRDEFLSGRRAALSVVLECDGGIFVAASISTSRSMCSAAPSSTGFWSPAVRSTSASPRASSS